MKKIFPLLSLAALLSQVVFATNATTVKEPSIQAASAVLATQAGNTATLPDIAATAYLVQDLQSKQTLAAKNPDSKIEPASLTQLMTAYLTFKALNEGKLKPEQTLTVSQHGWRTEGPRMFLARNKPAKVSELIMGLIVQSGNDAAITLAEGIAGSEAEFAKLMNTQAAQLGMKHTHFDNATGLPAATHLSTVRDLAVLAAAIIRDFPEFYKIYSEKSFTYNGITQLNHNLLLYRDPSVDGLKTGHSISAGYNLIASSHRNGRRVLSIVVGTPSAEARATESSKLLHYALTQFDTPKIYAANQSVSEIKVRNGTHNTVNIGFLSDAYITIAHGIKDIKSILESHQPVNAPIQKGQTLATLKLMQGNTILSEQPVVALEDVDEAGFFGRIRHRVLSWFKTLFANENPYSSK